MFKPVHGIRGNLTQLLTAFADAISIDSSSMTLLQKILGNSDYTYLLIRTSYDYEIVKTNGWIGNSVSIVRAQDGTIAQEFPIGASVEFVLSTSALSDIVNQHSLGEIELTGAGIVTVQKTGVNQYTISAPKIGITSDSDKILVGGEFPNFVISTPLLRDCCD